MDIFSELYSRSSILTITGLLCLAGAVLSIVMIGVSNTQLLGINAWIKPFKFFISAAIFTLTMAWLLHYLQPDSTIAAYKWVVIVVMLFEVTYIALQASKGQRSHFNDSSPYHIMMFSLMGTAISIMTLFTAYIGYRFFTDPIHNIPLSYLWGIRLGIILFVIFAFAGGLMGSLMSHTVGGPDGGPGIKLLNWSLTHGDLRIAHFAGMHALQVLPLVGYYLLTSSKYLIVFSIAYFLVVSAVLVQALMGLPLFRN